MKLEVVCEPGKPVGIIDSVTGDYVAFIPNGKTKIEQIGDECNHCIEHDKAFATLLISHLSQEG